jgi:large subunit ribosomal protein LX
LFKPPRASAFKVGWEVGEPMKAYRVTGTAPFGSQRQPFSYDVPAPSGEAANEHVYSILGSRHRMKRRSIHIDGTSEIDPRTSTEPTVLHHFRDEIAAQGGTLAPVAEEE